MTEPTSSGISDEMLAKVQDNETEEWMERYGDLVWARIYKAYPWWPAKICDLTELSGEVFDTACNYVGKRYCVYNYGANNCDFALPNQMIPYCENVDRLSNQSMDKSLLKQFKTGVAEANEIATRLGLLNTSSTKKKNKRNDDAEGFCVRNAKKVARTRIEDATRYYSDAQFETPTKDPTQSSDQTPRPTFTDGVQKTRYNRRKKTLKNIADSEKSVHEKKAQLYNLLLKWQEITPHEVLPPFPVLNEAASLNDCKFSDAPDVPMGVEYTDAQSSLSVDNSLLKSLPPVPTTSKPIDWPNIEFKASRPITHLLHHSVETQRYTPPFETIQASLQSFNKEHEKNMILHLVREENVKKLTSSNEELHQYFMVAKETVAAQSRLVKDLQAQLKRAETALAANEALRDTAKAQIDEFAAAVLKEVAQQKHDARALFVAMAAEAMNMDIDLLPTSSHPLVDPQHIEYTAKQQNSPVVEPSSTSELQMTNGNSDDQKAMVADSSEI